MVYPPPAEPILKEPLTTSLQLTPTVTTLGQGILGTTIQTSSGKTSTKLKDATHTSSADASNPTSHSIIGTPQGPPPTTPVTDIATRAMPTTTAALATPSVSSSPAGLNGVSTEWKVMGIAVIAISGLAVMVITVVFYDQWSKFLLDIFCCGKRKKKDEGFEEFVPDWEKGSWEVQLKQEDAGSQRYPSMEDLAHPPAAVTRKPTIRPLDPRPASNTSIYANPFESHLDYQQAPYENDPNGIIPDIYPHAQAASSESRQRERTHTSTLNPYDGIA
ncbi:hypothetical protein NEOLEDRAFT_1237980 [Neolentinus lepideus HHB14362 ss-1]|uniref:Uncharacterized protein n=1 Tax=Neolentinus lepideus HHB14362 ss-1 TaxID=1314782 RepID=A0A165W7F3_9AGAM|nr:hypothetical protein NEOLEDRAFT_1237980 [Neolentinus lepideus HHB14362 ss-1]